MRLSLVVVGLPIVAQRQIFGSHYGYLCYDIVDDSLVLFRMTLFSVSSDYLTSFRIHNLRSCSVSIPL